MILGKESTRHSISHLMLVIFFFFTNQNPSRKYKSTSGLFHFCKIYFLALMIIVLVKIFG